MLGSLTYHAYLGKSFCILTKSFIFHELLKDINYKRSICIVIIVLMRDYKYPSNETLIVQII